MNQVLVVGAGLGGSSTAYWLPREGNTVVLVEHSSRLGGLLRRVRYQNENDEIQRACVFLKWLKMVFIPFRALGGSFEAHIYF